MMIKNKLICSSVTIGLVILLLTGTAFSQKTAGVDINNSDYSTGVIDRITDKEIVIDDSLYTFAKGILFLSRQGARIEIRWFKKGDKIRFVSNSKNEAVILRKR